MTLISDSGYKALSKFTGNDETRVSLQYICIEPNANRVVATDGFKILALPLPQLTGGEAPANVPGEPCRDPVLVSPETVGNALAATGKRRSKGAPGPIHGNGVIITMSEGKVSVTGFDRYGAPVSTLTHSPAPCTYPRWDRVVSEEPPVAWVDMDARHLKEICEAAILTASGKVPTVHLEILPDNQGQMRIRWRTELGREALVILAPMREAGFPPFHMNGSTEEGGKPEKGPEPEPKKKAPAPADEETPVGTEERTEETPVPAECQAESATPYVPPAPEPDPRPELSAETCALALARLPDGSYERIAAGWLLAQAPEGLKGLMVDLRKQVAAWCGEETPKYARPLSFAQCRIALRCKGGVERKAARMAQAA